MTSKEKPAGHDREAEERCFAERYAAQPEREKPAMLIARAYNVFMADDRESAKRLLDLYFSEHADDTNVKISALLLRGRICESDGDGSGALANYVEAAEKESESEVKFGAAFVYACYVAGRGITESYDKAERYVSAVYDMLSDIESAYIANRLLSVFAEAKGDGEKAEHYGHKADVLLDEMRTNAKPLFFRAIKISPGDDKLRGEIASEMKNGRFALCDYDNRYVWVRKGSFGMHHVSIVYLYDVVCVTAYVTWTDVMTGQTIVNGVNGFTGAFIKVPLKSFVKKLVKKIDALAANCNSAAVGKTSDKG